jgi:hypothetical protein
MQEFRYPIVCPSTWTPEQIENALRDLEGAAGKHVANAYLLSDGVNLPFGLPVDVITLGEVDTTGEYPVITLVVRSPESYQMEEQIQDYNLWGRPPLGESVAKAMSPETWDMCLQMLDDFRFCRLLEGVDIE